MLLLSEKNHQISQILQCLFLLTILQELYVLALTEMAWISVGAGIELLVFLIVW